MTAKTTLLSILAVALALFAGGTWYMGRPDTAAIAAAEPVQAQDALVRGHSPILGREDAPVTIVEFFDPACEACRRFHPIVKGILEEYPDDVRVVVRYAPFHGEASEVAVKVLEAARMQGVFLPVMDALLEAQPRWASHGGANIALIMEVAVAAGLDAEAAETQMRAPDVIGVLNQDRADVEAVGIRGTPTFFVNGKPLPEFGAAQLIAMVEAEVAATTD